MMTLPYPPPYMDLATLAEHICVGESTIEAWIKRGKFPLPRKIEGKRLWRWKEIEKHLANPQDLPTGLPTEESITDATRQALASRNH